MNVPFTQQDLHKKHIEVQVSEELLDRAYEKAVSIFSDWEFTSAGGNSYLNTEINHIKHVIDITRDVVPPIAFALRHFGDSFPKSLVQKLRNKPQMRDTLFELLCLGFFANNHKVIYEPKLIDGKVPDLLVVLNEGMEIYVECKSHRFADAPYFDTFMAVSSMVCEAFTNQPIIKAVEQTDLRLELYLKSKPGCSEIEEFKNAISTLTIDLVRAECSVTANIAVKAVPRHEPLRSGTSLRSGRQVIGVEPTRVSLKDSYLLTYSWPGLDTKRRRLQRAMLSDARVQLRNIPANSIGMICIQTVSVREFLPDVHELIDRDQFSQIPVVWLNPSLVPGTESKIIFRDGARQVVEKLVR